MKLKISNYLNYGYGLEEIEKIFAKYAVNDFKDLKRLNISKYAQEIINYYFLNTSKKILNFSNDILNSSQIKKQYSMLDCKGFSYVLYDKIGFSEPVNKNINIRYALLSDPKLFYPKKIKNFLKNVSTSIIYSNHYFKNNYPAIAFAFGKKIKNKCFILMYQSDLMFYVPTYIREHFKGWRKILFAHIIEDFANTKEIYLVQSDDVLKTRVFASHPSKKPESWEIIYENTAKYFKMKYTELDKNINIQVLKRGGKVYTNKFYKL